ncbi:MAG: flagellar hook-basal body protein [Lachnospiraceae bacterium]|jgi:flagellar basal-body rod protein FlgG|nr:flagellar hook-basal body protein [Lachnospiraceae bacterium]MCR5426069.1 flagellar hook-basal body protein [Lachnospiraceae bacterium]
MVKGLYTAYTGMLNEQHRMDVLSNNMANVTTVGYKKEGTTSQAFDDVLTLKIKDSTVGYNLAQREGINNRGVKIGENYVDWSQGSFRITENTYDLALGGPGFFQVEFTNKSGETQTLYTRQGQFSLNIDGYLVNDNGDYILNTAGNRIKLNTLTDSTIDQQGNIWQNGQRVDQIGVVDFADYDYLERFGETYFTPLEGAQMTRSDTKMYSGYLEMSNVQTVSEMVNLIAISRQYEANQKIIQTIDGSLEVAVNQLGQV